MDRWSTIQTAAAMVALVALIGLIPVSVLWVRIILAAAAALAAAVWIVADRRRASGRQERAEQNARLTAVRLLAHQRHDWMNELQVLYGYIQLKKYDKLPVQMNKIIENMQKDSAISKLGVPELAMLLLAARASGESIKVETAIDMSASLADLPVNPQQVTGIVGKVLESSNVLDRPGSSEEQFIVITFRQLDDALLLAFEYSGDRSPHEIDSAWKPIVSEFGKAVRVERPDAENGCILSVHIPFNA